MLCAVPLRAQTPQTGVASLVVDLASVRTLSVERPDVMTRAVLPGSVMKVAAVAAALEAGAISERTTERAAIVKLDTCVCPRRSTAPKLREGNVIRTKITCKVTTKPPRILVGVSVFNKN